MRGLLWFHRKVTSQVVAFLCFGPSVWDRLLQSGLRDLRITGLNSFRIFVKIKLRNGYEISQYTGKFFYKTLPFGLKKHKLISWL